MLFLFLRHWPTTLIVSASVPLSLLVTLAVMYFVGLTINVMSMMGMMLAIGMLVDNAVVVTESVFRHRQLDPENPQAATLAGVKEVGVATLAGTATCVVVFLPILFGSNNQISIWLTHAAIPDLRRHGRLADHRADADPDGDLALPRAAAAGQQELDRAPAGSLHAAGSTGAFIIAAGRRSAWSRCWRSPSGSSCCRSSIPGKFIKFDPGAQDGGNQVFLGYNIKGSHPIDRVEAAVETVERHFEGAPRRARHQELLLGLRPDRARSPSSC